MKHNYVKSCENVRLRPLCEDDLEHLRLWRNNPENTTYLSPIPFITEDMQLNWYKNNLEDPNEITFAIEELQILNRVVGSLSLYNFNGNCAEFGKILIGDKEAHGKHVGTNALKALLELGFDKLGLHEIYLYVFEENIPAIRVYEKVGFHITEEHDTKQGKEFAMRINREQFMEE